MMKENCTSIYTKNTDIESRITCLKSEACLKSHISQTLLKQLGPSHWSIKVALPLVQVQVK